MVKYVIIEDEPAALRRLKRKINEIRPAWECVGQADGLETGKNVLMNKNYNLIISDIELSDGNCFELLKDFNHTPIIFITAYDHYAVKAFEFNGVHYLLKPVKDQQLHQALNRFESNPKHFENAQLFVKTEKEHLPQTIISRVGNKTSIINIKDVAFFYVRERAAFAGLENGKVHLIDQSLDALANFLPHEFFYRISRQIIVNKSFVKGFKSISSNRLALELSFESSIPLIVSKERTKNFKTWLKT